MEHHSTDTDTIISEKLWVFENLENLHAKDFVWQYVFIFVLKNPVAKTKAQLLLI